ncbi:methyltransferase domain-containing protein [Candidatus Nitrosacidococcus tergens]|uniref:Generic methyl-transferase n=1 Tax=Candidatus Nitrosacidococcus tergens TaxID=553981 RepID=A0A7G1Q862_9GAMM|nr:methyltransferase domain-containing protein [Candidatus Nitrosacidococcus tergens]CAB1274503.1 Generic methyl-transferase [Candidatus Nitrosacidococcus tergens]
MDFNHLSRQSFYAWFNTSSGIRLLEEEQLELGNILPSLFGYHIIQLGSLNKEINLLSSSYILDQVIVDIEISKNSQMPNVISKIDILPFGSETIDVVLLPHTLEYAPSPHFLLQEVQRVLIPNGTLIILGLNPWSFLGIRRFFPYKGEQIPWYGHFYSLTHIQRWLALLGFKVVKSRYFLFHSTAKCSRLIKNLYSLVNTKCYLSPFFFEGYLLIANKEVVRLNPVDLKWEKQGGVEISGVVEPVAQVHFHD